jgi:hypothetical protein
MIPSILVKVYVRNVEFKVSVSVNIFQIQAQTSLDIVRSECGLFK